MSDSRGFCENEPDFVFSPILHVPTSLHLSVLVHEPWVILQKPPEALAYAIYIEHQNPFHVCCIIYLSTGCGWGGA